MKRSKLLFILPFLIIGCSKPKKYPSLLNHFEKNAVKKNSVQRAMASAGANQCFKDILSVELLKEEIAEEEGNYASAPRINGKWKHLNLASLPIPQTLYLKRFGKRLGDLNNPDAYDYSSCADVPCIINKIYGKEDSIAGYVHYLWYLKTGSYLAANNDLFIDFKKKSTPGEHNGKKFPVASYLWSEAELNGFWRLLHLLKSYKKLEDLIEIQRVPRGEYYGFVSNFTCGLAYNNGIVTLQDECLVIDVDKYQDSFFISVLHELTHQLDYQEGKKIPGGYRSKQEDYIKLSGFSYKEYKNDDDEVVQGWLPREDVKLVSSYAGTSPEENFAETLAYFRVKGSRTKKSISDEHWNFTSKNYYAKKTFESSALMKEFVKNDSSLLSQLSFKAVSDCSEASDTFESAFFSSEDFSISILPSMVKCLGAKASEISQDMLARLKMNDPLACEAFEERGLKDEWKSITKKELLKIMGPTLEELASNNQYFNKIKEFYKELDNNTVAREIYLDCYGEENEKNCYQEGMRKYSREKTSSLGIPSVRAEELTDLFLAAHPIERTQTGLLTLYQTFVKSHAGLTQSVAKKLWNDCMAQPLDDSGQPTGSYFTVGDGYMASSLYNCLNVGFLDSSRSILKNLSLNGQAVQHPKEEQLLSKEVLNELQKELQYIYKLNLAEEHKNIMTFIDNENGSIRRKILADLAWMKEGFNPAKLDEECRHKVLDEISFIPIFHLKSSAFETLIKKSCGDMQATPEYHQWLNSSKSSFEAEAVVIYKKIVEERAREKAQSCLLRYPVNTNLNRVKFKKEREACLISSWDDLEHEALNEFSKNPLLSQFGMNPKDVQLKAASGRRGIQLKIIKENF